MKLLAICIPNYNRKKDLKRLITEIIHQIRREKLNNTVQLCISDDCSPEDPSDMVKHLVCENTDIDINYVRKSENMGMDYNFKDSVLMADTEYAWIIGNDDMITDDGINQIVDFLKIHNDTDFIVTPFDKYGPKNDYRCTAYPLDINKERRFDTSELEQRKELFELINQNSGIFGFLSNVVFRRKVWVDRKDCFLDKMNSIFIQMYMNIDALMKGAIFYYAPIKMIDNISDDDTNKSYERLARILIGFDGVVEFFFSGKDKEHFKEILTDAYVNGTTWEKSQYSELEEKCKKIQSQKNDLYRKYYIDEQSLIDYFDNKEVIIYGAGDYGNRTCNRLKKTTAKIIGIADGDSKKAGLMLNNYRIMTISEMIDIYNKNKCCIIIANHFGMVEMYHYLKSNAVDNIAIII